MLIVIAIHKSSLEILNFESQDLKMLNTVAIMVVLYLQVGTSCALTTEQDDMCLNNYSWSARWNDQSYVYQYTVTETTQRCLDACQLGDPIQRPNPEHAEKVHEVNTDFYESRDNNGDVITCLNITFEVNRHSASNLEGLLFTLEDHWNGDYEECFRLNFTTGLNSLSVFDPTTQTRNRLFHFDCFCDLKISDRGPNEYTLKIRSLPFQTEDCTLIDDQTVTLPVKVPVCEDPVRTWTDKYCQAKQETWNPAIAFYQAFPEYNTLRLTFEPAPPYYLITRYEIFIHILMREFFVDGQIIYVDDLTITPVEINGSIVNATSMEYEVNAKPGDRITVTIITQNGRGDEMNRKDGPVIIFQGNPCESNTCEPLGSCIPRGDDYFCQCTEGALKINNHTCIQNPCDDNTCGPLGSCSPLGQDYYCQCKEGTLNLNNHTCIQNPCDVDTCGPLGSCSPLGQDYYCQCQEGTLNLNNHTCIQNPCDVDTCGPLGSCSPLGQDYYCQCQEGTLNLNNHTCIQNPCDVDTCGPLGSCSPLGQDYYCQCQEGTLNLNNHTCIQNPCDDNTCGPLGSCSPLALGQDYYCQCKEGTLNMNNHTCIQSTEENSWQFITGAAVVGALVVFIIMAIGLYCKCLRKPHKPFPDLNMGPGAEPVPLHLIPAAQTSVDILFAYPEENCEFVNLVELLARHILHGTTDGTHGGIHPILPSHHTLEMGKQGQELWLERASDRANKILWICSAEMTEGGFSNFDKLLSLTKDERVERKDKHVVCFFSAVSSRKDVPRRLCDFRQFNLLQDLESMCFYLKNMEKHTLHYSDSMPYISGREPSAERTALKKALERWSGNRPEESWSLITGQDSGFLKEPCTFIEPSSVEDGDPNAMADAWQVLTSLSLKDESDNDNIDSAYLTGSM